jgi:hypothetical protein
MPSHVPRAAAVTPQDSREALEDHHPPRMSQDDGPERRRPGLSRGYSAHGHHDMKSEATLAEACSDGQGQLTGHIGRPSTSACQPEMWRESVACGVEGCQARLERAAALASNTASGMLCAALEQARSTIDTSS